MVLSEKSKAISRSGECRECYPDFDAKKYASKAYQKARICDVHFVDDIFESYLYAVQSMDSDRMTPDEFREHRHGLKRTVNYFSEVCETKRIND